MRVRQIGTLGFDANTNIIVDATNQDAPGVGFSINTLFDPQPFSVEIAFRRATRQAAFNAVNVLARELHNYAQRRQDNRLAVAGGVRVVVEDADGGASLWSFLRDGGVTLLGVEATSTGVIARVRVTGTLVGPFIDYTPTQNELQTILPYERRTVTLAGTSDDYLYKHSLRCVIANTSGLYNALLAVEERESATEASRIRVINPASVSSGISQQNWFSGSELGWLTRAHFASATGGTITYTVPATLPRDVYRVCIEIFCQTPPTANARYIVSWSGQPQIAETISGERSWYTPALITPNLSAFQLTLEIQNVPSGQNGTLVMPLVLIPTDGVHVWNVVTIPTLHTIFISDLQSTAVRPFITVPNGTVYGAPGFVSGRHFTVFHGVMAANINNSTATWYINSHRIEPASFA